MREDAYWSVLGQRPLRRRRVLAGAAAGAGALALAACGGSSSSSKTASTTNAGTGNAQRAPAALITPPSGTGTPNATQPDPFAGAKRGGTLTVSMVTDAPTLDPYVNPATYTKEFAVFTYSRLFKYKGGPGIRGLNARPTGDLAASAESTPDGLIWTVKLRPNAKFHNVAPVSGRAVTSDDVKFSWERATGDKGINRAQLSFVTNIAYPDAQTVVFTLQAPNAAFLDVLSDLNLLWIQPREADGRFDPTQTAIGSGPWIFQSYTPSVGAKFTRNPDWYESGYPLLDAVNLNIVKDYSAGLAQFQAGNLDAYAVNSPDLIDLRKQLPQAQLYGDLAVALYYCYFDGNASAPWRDARVRQAMSMAIDRDAILDLVYSVKQLQAAGIAGTYDWNNVVPAAFPRFWVDPKSAEQGDSAKNFKYDPATAKQLLSAAGFPNGFEAKFQYTGNGYGAVHNQVAEATAQFLNQIGIKTTIDVQDYASKYYTQTYLGQFDGVAFGPETSFAEAGAYPIRQFTPNTLNKSRTTDPKLLMLAQAQQAELDEGKRRALFVQIQQTHGEQMYLIPSSLGGGTAWNVAQQWVRNAPSFTTPVGYAWGGEQFPYWWKDK